jgi:hypothetical protein
MQGVRITAIPKDRRRFIFWVALVIYLVFLFFVIAPNTLVYEQKFVLKEIATSGLARIYILYWLGIYCIPILGLLIWGLRIFRSSKKKLAIAIVVLSLLAANSVCFIIWSSLRSN